MSQQLIEEITIYLDAIKDNFLMFIYF